MRLRYQRTPAMLMGLPATPSGTILGHEIDILRTKAQSQPNGAEHSVIIKHAEAGRVVHCQHYVTDRCAQHAGRCAQQAGGVPKWLWLRLTTDPTDSTAADENKPRGYRCCCCNPAWRLALFSIW
jgi:hypothetical protein